MVTLTDRTNARTGGQDNPFAGLISVCAERNNSVCSAHLRKDFSSTRFDSCPIPRLGGCPFSAFQRPLAVEEWLSIRALPVTK